MEPTNIAAPDYFHKVVDCQWACPAHTPVPEYIRLIAAGRYGDAYMINWKSNVFPGVLGRTCDRPCEPACRRGRVENEPVAICRLKRVAADYKGDIKARLPRPAQHKNGKRIALVGGGPASLTVARDLAPLGYHCVVFDADPKAGGMIRTQIPRFRLPESVIDEECGYILDLGVDFRPGRRIDSLKALLAEDWDAIFVGSGAPRGRDLDIPGRAEAAANIHIGIDWLSSVSFGHINKIGRRVIVLGGGNTAMDCCRSSRRLGGEEVTVVVRSGFEEMKASPWEKEDAMHEGIPILNFLVPKAIHPRKRPPHRRRVREGQGRIRRQGPPQARCPPASPTSTFPATTYWSRSARRTPSPGSSATSASTSTSGTCPRSTRRPWRSTNPKVFFGGDAAFGPKNIIWAVAHGHEAAVSIDKLLSRRGRRRPPAAGGRGGQPEDGHPRVELRQRHLRRPPLPGAAARQGGGARRHQGGGRTRLR